MSKIVKETVIEQLEERNLGSIYNESDYNSYYRKYNVSHPNKYYLALHIVSAFICNSPPVLPND